MKNARKMNAIFIVILIFILAGCNEAAPNLSGGAVHYDSFEDIPGVTPDEIQAIKTLQNEYDFFTYGVPVSTEAFYDENGEIDGFAKLLCGWLTDLFGIEFKPVNCEFVDIFNALETGEIDFAGGLAPTAERKKTYFMSEPIAERSLKYFYLSNSQLLSTIQKKRPPRLVMLEGSATTDIAVSLLEPGTYEIVYIQYNEQAYDLLVNGEADAFVHQNTTEFVFEKYLDIVSEDFSPPAFVPVAFTAQNGKYAAIISVIDKALENNNMEYLTELYNRGQREYIKHKLYERLTQEEINFINENPVIRLGAEYDNYPISFYNSHEKQWQGISHDVLSTVSDLTGMSFEIVNGTDTDWPVLFKMLRNGDIAIISELLHSPDREPYFIWSDKAVLSDRPILVSKSEYHHIELNEILHVKIGLIKETAYAERKSEFIRIKSARNKLLAMQNRRSRIQGAQKKRGL